MSTRQRGNRSENLVIEILRKHGYYGYASRGSRGIDVIALSHPDVTLPHLGIEIGGESKRVAEAFRKLYESDAKFPGMVFLVARVVTRGGKRTVLWYAHSDAKYTTDFIGALETARREAA